MKLITVVALLRNASPIKEEVKAAVLDQLWHSKAGKIVFFVYGFEKNAKSNIATNEEKAIKILAKSLFSYSDESIMRLIKKGSLIEVSNE